MTTVRLEGAKELIAALKALPKEIASKNGGPVRRALLKAAQVFVVDARARAPRGSDERASFSNLFRGKHKFGTLKASIRAKRDPDPRSSGVTERYTVGPTRKAWYAHLVEFGTVKQSAQPFMRPAYEHNKAEALNVFMLALAEGIARAAKKVAKARG